MASRNAGVTSRTSPIRKAAGPQSSAPRRAPPQAEGRVGPVSRAGPQRAARAEARVGDAPAALRARAPRGGGYPAAASPPEAPEQPVALSRAQPGGSGRCAANAPRQTATDLQRSTARPRPAGWPPAAPLTTRSRRATGPQRDLPVTRT